MRGMAGSSIRVVTVKRWVSIFLLALTTFSIAAITISLAGKAYSKVDAVPFRDLRVLARRLSEGPMPMSTLVALTMPMILNILLFMPWGFLMFIVLDRPSRPTHRSYLLAIMLAICFSLSVEAWQYFLPTRVTDVNDVIWNATGAVLGAIFGHLRKRIRVSFE